jgi:biopolymer transport protein ExbB
LENSYGLIQLFKDGGWMMYPLLLCSLLGFGVIFAKLYVLLVARRDSKKLIDDVAEEARARRLPEALERAQTTPGPVAAILLAGLNRVRESRAGDEVEQAMDSAGKIELGFLERGLVLLATVATVAPLLGFLGTVWGMIEAFGAIEAAGQVEATLVASGIKIALITTAAGLLIAIPINVAYNYFVTRIDQLIVDMDQASSTVLNLVWDVFGEAPTPVGAGAHAGTTATVRGTQTRPLSGDTQSTIVPDKDTMKSSDHSKLD